MDSKTAQIKFARVKELIIKGEKHPLEQAEWDELNALIDELKTYQRSQKTTPESK